jgi:hypothetical protein
MTTAPTPAPSPDPIDAYLDEAETTLGAALSTHGIDRVTARVQRQGETFVVTDLTEHVGDAEPGPLRDTPAIASGKGEHHGAFDSLATFIIHHVATLLTRRPEQFLCDGELAVYASGGISQPVDWAAKWAQEAEQRKKALREAKAPIIVALKELGVHSVTITYDGEGDSGQIEDISAHTADNAEINLNVAYVGPDNDARFSTLRDAIDELAWQCLDAFHEGFENNEGGCGDITINVQTGLIRVDHGDRVINLDKTVTEV